MFVYLQKSASSKSIPVSLYAAAGSLQQFPRTGQKKLLFIFSNLLSTNSHGSQLASQIIVTNIQQNSVLSTTYVTQTKMSNVKKDYF
jgi:hypothetical protein